MNSIERREWVFPGSEHEDQIPFLDIVKACVGLREEGRPSGEMLELMIEEAELFAACHGKKRIE
jgi:hypothetical protein